MASRDHVLTAVRGGFLQLGHGKLAPVKRLQKNDYVIYYSPRTTFPNGEPLKAFTAIGKVVDAEPHQVAQTALFHTYRRHVRYLNARETPIQPLLEILDLTRHRKNWGILFRRSSIEIEKNDFEIIRTAMTR